jgi:hypothetical protein
MQSTKVQRPVKLGLEVVQEVIRLRAATDHEPALVRITAFGTTATCTVGRLETDFGRGFELVKQGEDPSPEPYHVLVDGENSQCTCLGWLRHGHRHPCRHLIGCSTLLRLGLI